MKKLILSLLLCLAVLTGCQPGEINETIYFDQIGDNITDAHKVQDFYVVNLWADSSNISGGGGGNITGPVASTNNAIVRWDGVLGNALQDYTSNPPTISDTGDMDIDGDIASDSLITNYVDLTEAVEPAPPAANNMRMFALDEHGYSVLSYKDAGGMVRQFMRDSVFIAYNDTGATIAAGRIVYASGSTGTVPEIALAKADSASTMPAIGVTVERLLHGAYGRVMQIGILEDVNTSAYSAGDVLWVSETTAGIPTATQPTAPHISQEIGTILVDNAVTGAIQIVARSRIAFGVSENNTVQVDDTSVNATELAKWTAYGLEGYAQSGVTLPASPVTGDFFIHTPTGRTILYYYSGTAWIPIISLGSMTVYVDASDGTDSLAYGTGVDGDAFATVQYAVDVIPGLVGGNVDIYVNAETYNEDVIIRGKKYTGNYSIGLRGTLSQQATGTINSSVQGNGAVQGSITDPGQFGAYDNLLIYANSEYRIIDSDTANTTTIVGTWSGGAPVGTWVVYDWGTVIRSLQLNDGQGYFTAYDIEFDGASDGFAVEALNYSTINLYRCRSERTVRSGAWSTVGIFYCMIDGDGGAYGSQIMVWVPVLSYVAIYWSKIMANSNSGQTIVMSAGSYVGILYGTILDGDVPPNKADYGFLVRENTILNFQNSATWGYVRIRNFDTGIYAYNGGKALGTANNQYSNNTADETAVAGSYGYID